MEGLSERYPLGFASESFSFYIIVYPSERQHIFYLDFGIILKAFAKPRFESICLLLLLAALIALPSCKRPDEIPPNVSIAAPFENAVFESGTRVHIVGHASDNDRVSSLGAILKRVSDGLLVGSGWGNPDSEGQFDFEMELGDRYTSTGHYVLKVTAYDGEGNPGSDDVDLYLTELPKSFLGAYIAGEDAGGTANLYYLDTLGNVFTGPYLGQHLKGFVADNRYQAILAGGHSGPIMALHPGDFSKLYSLSVSPGFDPTPLRGFSVYERQLFVGNGNAPFIQRHSNTGMSGPSFDQAFYAPHALLADSMGLFAAMGNADGSINKVDRFNRNSTQLQNSRNLSWKTEFLAAAGPSAIAVASNLAGSGKVLLLDKSNLLMRDSINLPESIIAMEGVAGRLFVLMDGGLVEIDTDNGNVSSLLVTGQYKGLAYEPVHGALYLGKTDAVEIRGLDGSLVDVVQGSFGNVTEIEFHYNK